jgi:murein DD-endopeptidase MepM/ murein hydrolase activator NlpD
MRFIIKYMFFRIIIVIGTAVSGIFGTTAQLVSQNTPETVQTAPTAIIEKAPLDKPPIEVPPTMVWPFPESTITSLFGPRPELGGYHYGIDFGVDWNSPIPAVTEGTVIFAGWNYGLDVRIQAPDGLVYIYGHLNRIDVVVGQYVSMGQVIGLVGSTGFSTGPHLHLEVLQDGVPIDPMPMLRERTPTKYIPQ